MNKGPQTALQFVAYVTSKGPPYTFEFPDVPGCTGSVRKAQELPEKATAALESALREQLDARNKLPDWPQMHRPPGANQERLHVTIAPGLALAVQFRRMRLMKGWSQAELATRVGVSQQQIVKLEDPDCNPTFETVTKVAKAFNETLSVVFG